MAWESGWTLGLMQECFRNHGADRLVKQRKRVVETGEFIASQKERGAEKKNN